MYPLNISVREPALLSDHSNDLDFIYSTWVRSLGNQRPFKDNIDKNWFNAACHSLITKVLTHCSVLLAHDPNDPEQLFGYVVFSRDPRVLHFIYAKYDFRNVGVGKRLMLAAFENFDAPIEYTVNTGAIRYLIDKWNLKFHSHHLTRLGRSSRWRSDKWKKIKRLKVRDTVSAGVGSILPGNAVRPEVILTWGYAGKDLAGVQVYNLLSKETFIIPFSNVVEVVLYDEEVEEPKKVGRPKKDG